MCPAPNLIPAFLLGAMVALASPTARATAPAPADPEASPGAAWPLQTREVPFAPVGAGLGGVSFWMSYPPFADLMRTARWANVAAWDERGFPAEATAEGAPTASMAVSRGALMPRGEYTLTWEGEGAVTLTAPTNAVPTGPVQTSKGVHRQTYRIEDTPDNGGFEVRVESLPATNIRLWLPGLDERGVLWNPAYLSYLRPFAGTHFRFMDLNATNHSQQRDWSDRTPPDWSSFTNRNDRSCAPWPVRGAIPYEWMVALCNEVQTDLWITVPHQATDGFVRNLAHLLRTGIDAATEKQTGPALLPHLRIFVEYSNEVWLERFRQTPWVNENLPGANVDERYARRSVQIFDIFEEEFGGLDRLVRVLSTQTHYENGIRTPQRLDAIDYRTKVDALAITTYFSLTMEEWAWNHWPFTPAAFLDELERRIGSGPFRAADTHEYNQDSYWQYHYARQYGVPVISYEGNSHIHSRRRFPDPATGEEKPLSDLIPEFTDFLHQIEETPRFSQLYQTYLDRHETSGLRSHTAFVLMEGWTKYGQWGHIQHIGQSFDQARKYRLLLDRYHLPWPTAELIRGYPAE